VIRTISADLLAEFACTHAVIDVRSPSEYANGHIPGAHSVPLFSDQQRAVVGTLYVQKGKEEAIRTGLEIVGSQLADFVAAIAQAAPTKKILVYCWRGGMRSKSVASLLDSLGYDTAQLIGGYKAMRAYNRTMFETVQKYVIISGKTGSGKTILLKKLAQQGEQVVDLEGLARHKGSVFGFFGQTQPQPTQEQFENDLGWALIHARTDRTIWLEDESRMIGRCSLPEGLWPHMQQAPRIVIEVPEHTRRTALITEYGAMPHDQLISTIERLSRHVGSERTAHMLKHITELDVILDELLKHYDKTYTFSAERRKKNYPHVAEHTFILEDISNLKTISDLISLARTIYSSKYTPLSEHP